MIEYEVEIGERPLGVRFAHADRGETVVVHLVLENKVGHKLGLLPGDILIAINGKSVLDITSSKALELFRSQQLPFKASFRRFDDNDDFDSDQEEQSDTDLQSQFMQEDVNNIMHQLSTPKKTIGLSVGGAQDVNNFRKRIKQGYMPSVKSITFNGLLHEYYFDTESVQHLVKQHNENCSMLFYPTYCFAKCKQMSFDTKNIDTKNEYEYFLSVGLNSNINQNEFKRKHLNLIIILDNSGSMSDSFDNTNNTKMNIANKSVITLLKHLTDMDRFGLITFNNEAQIIQKLDYMSDIDKDELYNTILNIRPCGGTNFECGWNKAINLYDTIMKQYIYNKECENRIIILTDAQPNIDSSDGKSLLNLICKHALNEERRIYTTIIGIGLDFKCELVEQITQTRGCNYFSVNSTESFMKKMDKEFEYMVTPLVFNVLLKINCEGNCIEIDKIYGSSTQRNEVEFEKSSKQRRFP
eukprot:118211_1